MTDRSLGDRRLARLTWALLCAAAIVAIPGCSGCPGSSQVRKPADQKKDGEKKDEEKEEDDGEAKEDITIGRLLVLPHDEQTASINLIKPGHWVGAYQELTANNFDFQGELVSRTVDRNGQPIDVENTAFTMRFTQSAALPEGKKRYVGVSYYVPKPDQSGQNRLFLDNNLLDRRSGRQVAASRDPTTILPDYQFLLTVLSEQPTQFAFLRTLDSVDPPQDEFDENKITHYRVLTPDLDKLIPLADSALAWTCVAHVVWDGVDPNRLTPQQQDALLDWIHMGGQLAVSGPSSLDRLRGSFLEPYLPALSDTTRELTQADLEPLNDRFTLVEKKYPAARGIVVPPDKPLVGSSLTLREGGDAVWIPEIGELAAERSVGRGRILVTAFNLRDRALVAWPHYDGFWNAVVLRRPARIFEEGEYGAPQVMYAAYRGNETLPPFNSGLRIFTRDQTPAGDQDTDAPFSEEKEYATDEEASNADFRLYREPGTFPQGQSGVAGWNDRSGPAIASRSMLQEAAGITVPKADTVAKVLGVYLFALVPLNWLFFKLIGRVEWAWGAAPVIAIVGAFAVVRIAQLDIGFVRSRTEIAVLETSGDYHRGHLTRFIACYTSLSANYEFAFEDSSAVAMPYPPEENYKRRPTETSSIVDFRKEARARLAGYTVRSNSTGVIHSEEMLPLGGALRLVERDGTARLLNESDVALRDAGIVRRTDQGVYEFAPLGEVAAETSARVRFETVDGSDAFREWLNSPGYEGRSATDKSEDATVRMGPLLDLALRGFRLRKGETRLVAWTDQKLGDLSVSPEASQNTFRTLILAHLRVPPPPEPRLDANPRSDVIDEKRSTEDDLNLFSDEKKEEDKPTADSFPKTSP